MTDPADVLALLEQGFSHDPDVSLFGISHLDEDSATVTMAFHERHLRPGQTISGQTILKLIDTAAYVVIMGRLGAVTNVATTNMNVNFLRKPGAAGLEARGSFIKIGRRSALCEILVYSQGAEDRGPVAHATVSYALGL